MTAPPSAEEVAEIAKRLTEVQRDAVMLGKWNITPNPKWLIAEGLGIRESPYFLRLTTLGLAVRNYLIGETRCSS